jgi:hypothetical protein
MNVPRTTSGGTGGAAASPGASRANGDPGGPNPSTEEDMSTVDWSYHRNG